MSQQEVLEQVKYAIDDDFASVVLQSGETLPIKDSPIWSPDSLYRIGELNSHGELRRYYPRAWESSRRKSTKSGSKPALTVLLIQDKKPATRNCLRSCTLMNALHNYYRRLEALQRLKTLGIPDRTGSDDRSAFSNGVRFGR
ncbi:MAG: hypothetical protein U5L09_02050 [Bacteroidales bacterium]|nr:hypothetical protein [Bacteroidales bacterium]